MTFRGPFVKQLDGTSCAGSNCGCATCCRQITRSQRGVNPVGLAVWPPSPSAIRSRIDGGACGGTTFEENEASAKYLYGSDFDVRYGLAWADFVTLLESGRGAGLSILYSAVHGTRWDSCPTFLTGHAVYDNERAYLQAGQAYAGSPVGWYHLLGDSLADGRYLYTVKRKALQGDQWWPEALVKKATGARAGTGKVNASFTIDTEYPATVTIAGPDINIRVSPSATATQYGQTNSTSIVRTADGQGILPLTTPLPLIGWVTGGAWTAGGTVGNVWASVLLDGKARFIAKALVRVS